MDVDAVFVALSAPVLLVAFWILTIGLIAHLSGWQRLAQYYRATTPPGGRRWSWRSGYIGWAGYSGMLTLTAHPQGLFLEVLWPFRVGHPPLFIPWRDFHNAERKDLLWQHDVKVQVGFPPRATLRLPAVVFEESAGRDLVPPRAARGPSRG